MKIDEAIAYYGKNIRVTFVDGDVIEGLLGNYQTHADEPDEPESIDIYTGGIGVIAEVDEIAKIEALDDQR